MRRIVLWAGGLAAAFTIVMVVIHVPIVRNWLASRGHHGAGLCPLGYGTTGTSVAARARANAAQRGTAVAKARPALGFTLDETTAADLKQWAATHGITCTSAHGAHLVECHDVPGSLTGGQDLAATSVWFQLGPTGTLSAIRTVRRAANPAAVSAAFSGIERELTSQAGSAATRSGTASPEVLARAALRQAAVEYRFTNYHAAVRATNLGDGFALTEDYSSLLD